MLVLPWEGRKQKTLLNHLQNVAASSHLPDAFMGSAGDSAVFNLVPAVSRSSLLWKEQLTPEPFTLVLR